MEQTSKNKILLLIGLLFIFVLGLAALFFLSSSSDAEAAARIEAALSHAEEDIAEDVSDASVSGDAKTDASLAAGTDAAPGGPGAPVSSGQTSDSNSGRTSALSSSGYAKTGNGTGAQADGAILSYETDPLKQYEWLWNHAELFPEGKVEQAENNVELIDFLYRLGNDIGPVSDAESLASSDGSYGSGGSDGSTVSESSDGSVVSAESIPYFYQWDDRWGFHPYGNGDNGVIGITGCGPTCLSMVLCSLLEDPTLTPDVIADYSSENGYYVDGHGTQWSLLYRGGASFGITGKEIRCNEETILRELDAGRPIIGIVGAGHFTQDGHFLVISGYDEDGLIIHDPNSVENSMQRWPFEEIRREIRALFSFRVS